MILISLIGLGVTEQNVAIASSEEDVGGGFLHQKQRKPRKSSSSHDRPLEANAEMFGRITDGTRQLPQVLMLLLHSPRVQVM